MIMDLIKKYLNETSKHLFKIKNKNILKKVFPVTIKDELYALKIEWSDADISVRLYETEPFRLESSKGKKHIRSDFKDAFLFHKEDIGGDKRSYAVKSAKYYQPLMDYIRAKIKKNEDEIHEKLQKAGGWCKGVPPIIEGWVKERPDLYKPQESWLEKVKQMA